MQPTVYFDITEFLGNPTCRGIQRLSFEILRSWPKDAKLQPCTVHPQAGLVALPVSFIPMFTQFFTNSGKNQSQLVREIREYQLLSKPVIPFEKLQQSLALLIPEISYISSRIRYHQQLIDLEFNKTAIIGYDFLPSFHPEWFPPGIVSQTMSFLRLMTKIRHRAFISTQTARDFRDRILRQPARPLDRVIPLGSDALGFLPPKFDPQSREFLVLGSLEPHKNHAAVLDAIEPLWQGGSDCRLTFVGNVGGIGPDFLERIQNLEKSESRFEFIKHPPDSVVLDRIRACRATIYPSLAEGYGLPPVESLALGVPVIVTATIPVVEMIPNLGQIRLETPDSTSIQKAIIQMLDDDFAKKKYLEIEDLQPMLPRWSDLGPAVFSWLQSIN